MQTIIGKGIRKVKHDGSAHPWTVKKWRDSEVLTVKRSVEGKEDPEVDSKEREETQVKF